MAVDDELAMAAQLLLRDRFVLREEDPEGFFLVRRHERALREFFREKLGWTLLTFAGMAVSFALLARATKTLPLGTAYAVWTGIGALGSVIVGIVFFKEPVTAARIFFAALLLAGIVGLKLTAA